MEKHSNYNVSLNYDDKNNIIISNENYTIIFNITDNKCISKNDIFENNFFCDIMNTFNFENTHELILSSFDIFSNLHP